MTFYMITYYFSKLILSLHLKVNERHLKDLSSFLLVPHSNARLTVEKGNMEMFYNNAMAEPFPRNKYFLLKRNL